MRRTNKSGGRQPAVVFGRSNDVRDFSQITCKCVPHTTAGLRQPLLIAPRPFGAEYDIWDVQTHVHKSGGRQPAVVGKPNAVRRKSPTIRRRCDGRTRAAGANPPCVCKPASAIAMRRISAFRVRIECTPRGAYAPRSSVAVRMSADEKAIFAMYIRMPARAAGVSPPWSVNRTRCGENRPPFDDDATDEQERRASARRAIRKTHWPGRLSKGAEDCRCSARDPRCHCGEAAFSLLESTCAADVLPETPLPLRYHNHGRVQESATG
jgi:hypothetical protein